MADAGRPTDTDADTAGRYLRFAEREARGQSPVYRDWASGIAGDRELMDLVDSLPEGRRQPNLVLAAARYHGAEPGPFAHLRTVLLDRWDAIRVTILTRRTQTNEPGRCAALLPLLGALPQPLALLEVGASAGLCLYPDRYSYRYSDGTILHPADGPSAVVLECDVTGPAPLPARLPEVVWRAGIDLNPLDVSDPQDLRWLETLVWPEQEHRRQRLQLAGRIAAAEPARLVHGDIAADPTALARLAASAPSEATLVVFHSAVLAYLDPQSRESFAAAATVAPGHWIANEGASVIPYAHLPAPPDPSASAFVLALNGSPVAYTGPHGQYLRWFAGAAARP